MNEMNSRCTVIVLTFFLQYLINAENLFHSSSGTTKSTLISNNIIYIYGFNLERRILDTILYKVDAVMSHNNYCNQFCCPFCKLAQYYTPPIDQAILPYPKQN
jgi:hypothetical protein